MAKLVVSLDGAVEGHYFLDKARFSIGRLAANDIALNHPGISNLHAVIITMSNDHVLEDADSTNGVMVNGEKIIRHILQNNDVIELSGFQLKYVNQRATSDMDFDKTMISTVPLFEAGELPHQDKQQAQPLLATAVSSARSVKTSFPLGGVRDMQSREKIIINAPLKTFGETGGQVVMISRRPRGYYATHVEGNKYPKVNGKSIGTQPCLLQQDDLIESGEVQLKFFMES